MADQLTTKTGVCVFSIDVEDWFHIMDLPTAPPIAQWHNLPSRVERNFFSLLDLLEAREVKATCFFLGWVAKQFPQLVREAAARGHEVASHGYSHELIYKQSPQAFLADVSRAKALLEDLTGAAVLGYRAPGFSVTAETPWFFEYLAKAGYRYDSSIFPAERQHGGLTAFQPDPCVVRTAHGPIVEIPISVARFLGKRMCFFGGGYLRLFPYWLIRMMAGQVLDEERPLIFYIHPREIDPEHPRLDMPWSRRVKSYIGLASTRRKIERLLLQFNFLPFARLLADADLKPRDVPFDDLLVDAEIKPT